jgi:hypothetical protein
VGLSADLYRAASEGPCIDLLEASEIYETATAMVGHKEQR